MGVEAKALQEALANNKSFILDNLETITLKKLRHQLEQELGLEKDALKPEKDTIAAYVDKLIAEKAASEAAKQKKAAKKSKQKEQAEEDDENNSENDDSEEERPKKKKKKQTASESPPPPSKAAPRVYSKRVDKLRSLCRQATITIPPNIYVKNKTDKELEAALIALLEKNGLDEHSGPQEVAKAKQKLQIQRDLEGIDTSNIIEDGPRSRRRATAERPSYKELLKDAVSESDEEEEEEESDKEQGDDSNSDDEKDASEVSADEVSADEPSEDDASAEEEEEERVEKKDVSSVSPVKKGKTASTPRSDPLQEIHDNTDMSMPKKKQTIMDWSDDDDDEMHVD